MSTLTEAAPAAATGRAVELTYREAINAALDDAMAADPRVAAHGRGRRRRRRRVQDQHRAAREVRAERVRNTPICENGFIGVALGMSLVGHATRSSRSCSRTSCPTAGDAIVNQLPKYRYMSGGQFAVPVTVRVICGGDRPLRHPAQRDRRELVHGTSRACGS